MFWLKKLQVKLINGLVQNSHNEFVICGTGDEFHFLLICYNTNVTIHDKTNEVWQRLSLAKFIIKGEIYLIKWNFGYYFVNFPESKSRGGSLFIPDLILSFKLRGHYMH